MGLTSSLYTSLSGLSANSQALSVAGNNIANSNTTGYKTSRVTFETAIVENLGPASAPTGELGGTNPAQIGHGVRLGGITRKFTNGSLQPTGVNTDMALEGDGFFVVREGVRQVYSRAGNFQLDGNYDLVTNSGGYIQGYGIDENFNVIEGVLGNVQIPLGILTLAQATSGVNVTGNLNADGDLATAGSISETDALYTDAFATTPATPTDTLASLFDADGNALFSVGDVISIVGATRGGATFPTSTFEVGATNTTGSTDAGTTVQDFMNFLQNIGGIHTTIGGGVTMNAGGQIQIESNAGTEQTLLFESGNFVVNQGAATQSQPFTMTQTQDAVGESTRTGFVAYDSLGNSMIIELSFALVGRDDTGTQWRYFLNSEDDTDATSVLGTGTMSFGNNGELLSSEDISFQIDRDGTGAGTPQTISLDFLNPADGTMSALAGEDSNARIISQDGAPIGSLEDFSVTSNGTISGQFSNGLLRDLGRVVISTFSNSIGLEELGGSMYGATVNSGAAQILTPGEAGSARVVGQHLEASNVELSEEFINLINASTGFSANSRVLTTSDEMLRELLSAVR